MSRRLGAEVESFPVAGHFSIARGSRTEAIVVTATITERGATGRGECVPYARYGETPESVMGAIEATRTLIEGGGTRNDLLRAMPPGAARNALDCALFDLEAKLTGRRAYEIAGLEAPSPVTTAYTISLGTPEAMAAAAAAAASRPLLKVKLGGDGDEERIAAVRAAAPGATLIVDANEAWSPARYPSLIEACERAEVRLVEQPFRADGDALLADLERPIPVCADESAHVGDDLTHLRARYDAVNVKLDKSGGLTAALLMVERARTEGFLVMLGCMLGSSLAMAPAVLAAQRADYVDLDGPLLLARDRHPALNFEGSRILPPERDLWG